MNEDGDSQDTPSGRLSGLGRRDYLQMVGAAGLTGGVLSAASGTAGAATLSRTLTIEGTGTRAPYEFTVEGDLAHSSAMGASRQGTDTITGRTAKGQVTTGRDSYTFTGEITNFAQAPGQSVRYYLNGEPLTDTVAIEDIPEGRRIHYELRVDGEVMKSGLIFSATIDENDEITPRNSPEEVSSRVRGGKALAGETYVLGGVNDGADRYVVSGEITGFHADGQVNLYVNGELVDEPAQFVRTTFTFESTDGTRATYEFATNGDITKSQAMGATLGSEDTVDAGTADGVVAGSGRDSYAFTGEVTEFTSSDNLRVFLNREVIDAAVLSREPSFENTLTVDGGGGTTSYRLSVDGLLEENYGLTGEDSIDGSLATGEVGGGRDSYTFSGTIENFSADTDGSYTVFLNGEEVDPEVLGETQTAPDAEQLPNEVTVTGLEAGRSEYGIGVSGTLATGDRSNTWTGDNASYEYARGTVTTGSDDYAFSGEIGSVTDFENVQIDINRENEQIVVSNTGGSGTADYEITVSGTITPYPIYLEPGDGAEGGTATGTAGEDPDIYGFDGELLGVTINGAVELDIDFNERPLTERELNEVKSAVGESDQYSAIEQAVGEDNYVPELESAAGVVRRYQSGDFQPENPEGRFLEFTCRNDGAVDAEVNCQAFSPLSQDDIELVVSVENAMGHLADLYTNKKIVSEQEDGYVV